MTGPYDMSEDEYIVWAVQHYGTNREIAHDLKRTMASIGQRIKKLRESHDLPDRRQRNAGKSPGALWRC